MCIYALDQEKSVIAVELEKIRSADLSNANRDVLEEFVRELESLNLNDRRIARYGQSFRAVSDGIDFDLVDAEQEQIRELVRMINRDQVGNASSVWTRKEYRQAVKRFYRDRSQDVSWITVHPPEHKKPKTDPRQLPREHHVQELVNAATNTRDAALIFALWDTGARISELLNVQWQDVDRDGDVWRLRIRKSKTGQRTVPVVSSISYLRQLERPSGYLFTRMDGEQLSYRSARHGIDRAAKHADLPDRIKTNPHAFRKGRATDLARQGWNAYQMMEYFGWNSVETAQQYVRMSESDLEEQVRKTAATTDAVQTTLA